MKTKPHFTLILASYNHKKFMPEAVRSVYAQTVPPDRIIYFDDGSTDGTRELARELLGDDPRVEWLPDCEINKGVVARMIQAAEQVRHGYVVALASDDAMSPRCIEIHRDLLLATGAEWSCGSVQVTDDQMRPLRVLDPIEMLRDSGMSAFDTMLSSMAFPPAHGWCYSIDLYRRVGGYDPRYMMEDRPMGLRFAKAAEPAVTHEIVEYARTRAGSFLRWQSKLQRESARMFLGYLRERPMLALRSASGQYLASASGALEHKKYGMMLVDVARAVALWPVPTAPHYRVIMRKAVEKSVARLTRRA